MNQEITMSQPVVYSMYWDNIPDAIKDGQEAVFKALGVPFKQERAHKKSHGAWMNEVIARHDSDDILVFCDIDAFPIHQAAYMRAVDYARQGGVFGLAQFANHKKNDRLYAGPMFMAFRKNVWEALGSPALSASEQYDAAEEMSVLATRLGVPLQLVMPSSCLIPKWSLAEYGVFGIGTFYGDCEYFHLFESRTQAYEQIFMNVVDDVVSHGKLNFKKYLEQLEVFRSEPPKRKLHYRLRKILKIFN